MPTTNASAAAPDVVVSDREGWVCTMRSWRSLLDGDHVEAVLYAPGGSRMYKMGNCDVAKPTPTAARRFLALMRQLVGADGQR